MALVDVVQAPAHGQPALLQQDAEVVGLLTTFNEAFDRVAMHGVRRTLVEAQAAAAGLPLWRVSLRGRARMRSTSGAWPR